MPTVLVVDDSSVDRRLAAGLLEDRFEIQFAENGKSAMESLASTAADVIVSDLQMPEMDGLELVNNVRLHHPEIPVVIMTAHGSEAAAVQALGTGAASYVPKSQLNVKLLNTVEEILDLARTDHNYTRLIGCSTETTFSYLLENDEQLIAPLVDLTQQMVFSMGICDATDRMRIGMALEQSLLNAIYHGNLAIDADAIESARVANSKRQPNIIHERQQQPPYKDRLVDVHIQVTRDLVRIRIRDEGGGFDSSKSIIDEKALAGDGGRGLVLMRSFMDEVSFGDQGREVIMVKRR